MAADMCLPQMARSGPAKDLISAAFPSKKCPMGFGKQEHGNLVEIPETVLSVV